MKRTRRTFWWVVAGPLVVLAAITWQAWPYLAITGRTGSHVLVVEGWMEEAALQQAAQLVLDSGYTRVYTTGTVRPFSYYLRPGHGLSVVLREAAQATLEVDISGLPGAGFTLVADGDTLLNRSVGPEPQVYTAPLPRRTAGIQLTAWSTGVAGDAPSIFVADAAVGGVNINLLQERSWFTRPEDVNAPAWPTYAQKARDGLIRLGVPSGTITAVPAYGLPRSRTWGNAHAFGIQARNDGLTAFDVATVGVHARRSRNLFQAACGPGVRVGVVALTDPYCTHANWWRSSRGWLTVLKEVFGTPEKQAVRIKHSVLPPK
ncbi:MAG: hypothetical protein IT230_07230 [Flavobacteriales bacterium]|nr:hypothetical protein [Flavobacteriales bacterium]